MRPRLIVNCNTRYKEEIEYTCHVIFNTFWDIDYSLINDGKNDSDTIEIIFHNKSIKIVSILFNTSPSIWLTKESHPQLPLRERNLDDLKPHNFLNPTVPVIYGKSSGNLEQTSDESFNIDLFGSIFFMLTRYEELNYDVSQLDTLGRFNERNTLAFRAGYYTRALVNEYLDILWNLIKIITKDQFTRKRNQYRLIVSHDIDFPLSISTRTIFGLVKNLIGDIYIRRSLRVLISRLLAKARSLLGLSFNDPYSTFDYLMECAEKYHYHCTFNFIPSHEPYSMDGKRRVDYALDTPYFHEVLTSINTRGHYIGFHPSFLTFCNVQQTSNELRLLKSVMAHCKLTQNHLGGRQHFLRWRNPITWQIWEELGLTYDSSSGYEGLVGFRTGTCFEHPVFDLLNRKKLHLVEIPLMVMDTAVLNLSSEKFDELFILDIYQVCKHYNGIFTLLYHNNNVVSPIQRRKYEQILKKTYS